MKSLALALVSCALCAAALAQTVPTDTSKARPVASPNKTQFSTLAAGSQKPGGAGGGGGTNTSAAAISLFDATGKNLGRMLQTDIVLLPYSGDVMSVPVVPYLQDRPSGKLTWRSLNAWVYYASSDCSGQAYLSGYNPGTRYVGTPTEDGSGQYMLVTDANQIANVTLGSMFGNDGRGAGWTCFVLDGAYPGYQTPVVAALPLAGMGTPPFSIR